MDEQQQQEFNQLLEAKPYAGVKAMNKTVFERGLEEGLQKGIEKGIEKGLEKGRQEGLSQGRILERRDTLRLLVAERFGELSATANERLEQMAYDQLAPLIRRVYQVNSLKELGLED